MNKQEFLEKRNNPKGVPYAGGVCGRCGVGCNNCSAFYEIEKLDADKKRILKAKYGQLCMDCFTEVMNKNKSV